MELIPEPILPDKTKVVPGVQLIAYRESPDKTKVVPGVPELIPEVQSRVCFRSVQQIAQSNNRPKETPPQLIAEGFTREQREAAPGLKEKQSVELIPPINPEQREVRTWIEGKTIGGINSGDITTRTTRSRAQLAETFETNKHDQEPGMVQEKKLRPMRILGKLLEEMETSKNASNQYLVGNKDVPSKPRLSELGITKNESTLKHQMRHQASNKHHQHDQQPKGTV